MNKLLLKEIIIAARGYSFFIVVDKIISLIIQAFDFIEYFVIRSKSF